MIKLPTAALQSIFWTSFFTWDAKDGEKVVSKYFWQVFLVIATSLTLVVVSMCGTMAPGEVNIGRRHGDGPMGRIFTLGETRRNGESATPVTSLADSESTVRHLANSTRRLQSAGETKKHGCRVLFLVLENDDTFSSGDPT